MTCDVSPVAMFCAIFWIWPLKLCCILKQILRIDSPTISFHFYLREANFFRGNNQLSFSCSLSLEKGKLLSRDSTNSLSLHFSNKKSWGLMWPGVSRQSLSTGSFIDTDSVFWRWNRHGFFLTLFNTSQCPFLKKYIVESYLTMFWKNYLEIWNLFSKVPYR